MIIQIVLLILVIINLAWMSFLAFRGRRNWLLVFAFLEMLLGILFALSI